MLKIGDFSRLSQVSVKTLRYYDEVALLKPTQVDEVSGYRYYSVAQLRQLHRILALRDLGFSLDQIGYVLEADLSIEELRGMLRLRRAEQQQRLLKEQERLDRVGALLQLIHQENTVNTDAVITKDTAAQRFASIRKTIPAYNQIGQLFAALFRVLPCSATRGPCFAICMTTNTRIKTWTAKLVFRSTRNIRGCQQYDAWICQRSKWQASFTMGPTTRCRKAIRRF